MKSLTQAIAFLALIGITICHLNSKGSTSKECKNSIDKFNDDVGLYWKNIYAENYPLVEEVLEKQSIDLESIKNFCQSELSQECIDDYENFYDGEVRLYPYIKNGDTDAKLKVYKELNEITKKMSKDCKFSSSDLSPQKSFVF